MTIVEPAGLTAQIPAGLLAPRLTGIAPPATTTRVAELVRGDHVLVIVAPWFKGGALVDDDVMGFTFAKSGSGWAAVGEPVELSNSAGREKANAALGGSDWTVNRTCGAPASALATRANDAVARFSTALTAKDDAGQVKAWTDFASLWSTPAVTFADTPTSFLLAAGKAGFTFACTGDTPSCTLKAGPQSMPAPTERCGDGWVFAVPG
jgi:hypothetical protein